jgi:hypothetical protein
MASDQNKQGPGKFRPGLFTKAKMLWDQFLAQPAVPHDVGKPVRQADWAIGSCGRQVNDRYWRFPAEDWSRGGSDSSQINICAGERTMLLPTAG